MTNGIVLGTGDLSEIALGWCTYNGDHMAMFAVNNDVPKTIVRKVCAWWAKAHPGKAADALLDIIATPVSPELVKGQVTENTIGPYELHDFFLWNFIVNEMGSKALQSAAERHFAGRYGSEEISKTLSTFMRRFFTQAFKRNCQCDGVKVFPFELSPHGWWIPSDLGPVKL
jgi:NAD+ synthase (glutamine-hydrolysing)